MALQACNISKGFSEVMKWDEPWDLKRVWNQIIPQTVFSSSFTESFFTLFTVDLIAHLCYFTLEFSLRCLLLSVVILYLAGFYLLAANFHPLIPICVSLCMCVSGWFLLTMLSSVIFNCDALLVSPGDSWLLADRLDKLRIYARFIFSGMTHGGFKTPCSCYLLCRAAEVTH